MEYQTLILRGELEAAEETLPSVPKDQNNKIARFLEGQGYKEMALKVATDPEHRFDLALSLGDLQQATEIAREQDTEHKWKTVGDAALTGWDIKLAQECFVKAKDLGSLLLLYSATSDESGLRELASLRKLQQQITLLSPHFGRSATFRLVLTSSSRPAASPRPCSFHRHTSPALQQGSSNSGSLIWIKRTRAGLPS